MRTRLLLTVVGNDRTGLVEALAQRVAAAGGNWEQSRMARMAGQFAGIVLVTIEAARADALLAELRRLDGLELQVRPVDTGAPELSGERVHLQLTGTDRAGIVRDVSKVLVGLGVNVEVLESEIGSAPMSGESMFTARAVLNIPAGVPVSKVRKALETLGGELMVDLTTAPET